MRTIKQTVPRPFGGNVKGELEMSVYTAVAILGIGRFKFCVLAEHESDAIEAVRLAAIQVFRMPYALIQVKGIRKTNKRSIASMQPIENCTSYIDGQWAWCKRVSA